VADPKFIARQITITAPATGTWNVSHPELVARGITPKAVIVMASAVDSETDKDISTNASGSWGVYDGTDQSAQNWFSKDAQSTSQSDSGFKSSTVARVGGLGGETLHLEMDATALVSGGGTFNVSTSDAGQVVRVTFLFLGGTELDVTYFSATANLSTTTVTVGFETDVIFASGRRDIGADSEADVDSLHYHWSMITAINDGAGEFDDIGKHNYAKDGLSTIQSRSIITNDRAKFSVTLDPTASDGSSYFENVTSTTFDYRESTQASDHAVFGLALDLGTVVYGQATNYLTPIDFPVGEDTISYDDLGFLPELIYSPWVYRNTGTVSGVSSGGGMAGGLNISDGSSVSGHHYSDNHNVSTSKTRTAVNSGNFFTGFFHGGTLLWSGDIVHTADGFDIVWIDNSTEVLGHFHALGIENQGAWLGETTGCASVESCGTPTVSVGAVDLVATGCPAPGACGTATVSTSIGLTATGCAATGSCGTPVITPPTTSLTATGCPANGACGTPVITPPTTALTATGCAASGTCGTTVIAPGAVNLTATGCAATGVCGTASVSVGAVVLAAVACLAMAACGTPTISVGAFDLVANSCPATGSCGTPTVSTGAVNLTATGCPATGACGTPTVSTGAVTLTATGCTATGACGTPTVTQAGQDLTATGCTATGDCGTPTLTLGAVDLTATGCPATGACGDTTVGTDAQVITANSCSSVSKCGIVFLQGGTIPETMHTRIKNALICAARLGTFIKVDQQCSGVGDCGDTATQSQGLQVAPATILVNEVRTKFAERDRCSPCGKHGRRRTQWMWKMILRFDCDVTTTLFDEQIACTPVVLPRLPEPVEGLHTKNRQVVLQLLDIVPKHPPGGKSSSGAEFHYIFEAQTSA